MKVLLIVTVVLAIVCTTTWANTADCDGSCDDYAECNNNTCVCIEGYTGNGTYCYDIDECYSNSTYYCGDYAYCYNTNGSYYCECFEGYTGYGSDCTDIDECYLNSTYYCGDYAYCYNTNGSYYCECFEGYTGYGSDCTRLCDVPCGYNAYCYNGSCYCDYGYTGYPYYNCTDIDECYLNSTYYCGEYAYCYNTDGGYYCECFEGYTGYGSDCTKLCDEPCGYNAYCNDSYCSCDYGYTGDPYSDCYDINECEYYDDDDICEDAYCSNTDGSYTCYCDGYYYYSEIVEDCVPFEGVYEAPAFILEGCDPNTNNYEVRQYITYKVQEFLQERLDMYYEDYDV